MKTSKESQPRVEMPYRPDPESKSKAERLAERIIADIQSGLLVPGQRLVESDLIEDYGVNRGPVREALRILAGDGIVELIPRRGARVRKLEREDIQDLFPVLSGLLLTVIRLAIDRARKAPFRDQLQAAREGLRQARELEDFGQFQRAGIRYSEILHDAADNRYLTYLNAKLQPHLFRHQLAGELKIEDWDSYAAHFEAMHRAIMAGDLHAVERLIREHEKAMVEMLEQEQTPAVWR